VAQDVAVLERARLALVRVADQVLVARELLRHEAPLEARREARAPPAAKRALLHLGDDRRRRSLLREDPPERLVAAALHVVVEPPVAAVEPRRQHRIGAVVQELARGVHRSPSPFGRPSPRAAAAESSSTSASSFSPLIQLTIRW